MSFKPIKPNKFIGLYLELKEKLQGVDYRVILSFKSVLQYWDAFNTGQCLIALWGCHDWRGQSTSCLVRGC